MSGCPECGAERCEELFHAVLALDHSRRAPWGPLHGVTVSCYLLQHPSRLPAPDRPLAILAAYLDGGLTAVKPLTNGLRRANRAGTLGKADTPATAPDTFDMTIADVAADGTFPADGFESRLTEWAAATLTAWQKAQPRT